MNDAMDRIKAISERLKSDYNAQSVVLFGSYARGEETEDSDVDILVIEPTNEPFFRRIATAKRLMRDLRNGLPVSAIVLTREELIERIKMRDQFIKEILEEGTEL